MGMVWLARQVCVWAVFCFVWGSQSAYAASLFGIDFNADGKLLSIDSTTGNGTIVGLTNQTFKGLSYDPGRQTLLAVDDNGYLFRIDPATANVDLVGRINNIVGEVTSLFVNNLAYIPSRNALFTELDRKLIKIDPDTAFAEVIAETGVIDASIAFTYDPSRDVIYSFVTQNNQDRILAVNPDTAETSVVVDVNFTGPVPGSSGVFTSNSEISIQGLAYDPVSGTLFAAERVSDQLVTIDLNTGEARAIGPLGFPSVSSLTIGPSPVPLPPAVLLFGGALGSLAVLSALRRRRNRAS